MKNTCKLFGAMRSIAIIALVAVIGFAMTACPDGGGDDDPPPKGVVSQPPTTNLGDPVGVWVDENGNIRIDAPVKTRDDNGQLIDFVGTGTEQVRAGFSIKNYEDDEDHYVSEWVPLATGTIANGRLAISIPRPNSNDLEPARNMFLEMPGFFHNFIKTGADVKVGGLELYLGLFPDWDKDTYWPLDLYDVHDGGRFADLYGYCYSEGDVTISGRDRRKETHDGNTYNIDVGFGLLLKQGWNSVSEREILSSDGRSMSITTVSKAPPRSAVWVLEEKDW